MSRAANRNSSTCGKASAAATPTAAPGHMSSGRADEHTTSAGGSVRVVFATVEPCHFIDDAEAKCRGVPVAQVQAENALAKEKAKTAALEKQISELQKKIAEGNSSAAPGTAGSSSTSGLNFDGPAEKSPLYDDLIARYMRGDWQTLLADLTARQKEIAALPEGNRADLADIRQAITECRPSWWDQVKDGKTVVIRQQDLETDGGPEF